MTDRKQFLLELADLMDKHDIEDLELARDEYCVGNHLEINFKQFDDDLSTSYFSFEGYNFITSTDIRQKAEEL